MFVAHNVVNKKDEMEPFLRTILAHPSLYKTIVSPSGATSGSAARASAGETETRTARPSTVDYVDGTVGMD